MRSSKCYLRSLQRKADHQAGSTNSRGKIDALFTVADRFGACPSTSPEGFVEARFINELETAGFFEEMNRQYGK